jgi:hypothetical protein
VIALPFSCILYVVVLAIGTQNSSGSIEGGGGKAFYILSHAMASGSGIRHWSRRAITNFFRTKYSL